MWATKIFALLLPLGVWLLLSASTPRTREGRIAASGLIVMAVSTLLYFICGFGFMFGGIGTTTGLQELSRLVTFYTIPIANQMWGLIGLRGFFLADIGGSTGADLFITYLPIVASSAMLLISVMANRTGLLVQVIFASIISGILVPIIGFWMWGGGWLAALGTNVNLGHGAVDIGNLTTAALVAGGAGLVWIHAVPRRLSSKTPDMPSTVFPFRALCGVFLSCVGIIAFVIGNPLYSRFAEAITGPLVVNLLLVDSLAVITAVSYSTFTTRHPDMASAARAALAGTIAVVAGSAILPIWYVISIGILAGLLSTLGVFVAREVLHWPDDSGLASTILVPAILGLLSVGLFANGAFGQGWNGVGTDTYIGISGMGIVGAFADPNRPADSGQLTAQFTAISAILGFTFLVTAPFAIALRRNVIAENSLASDDEPVTQAHRNPIVMPAFESNHHGFIAEDSQNQPEHVPIAASDEITLSALRLDMPVSHNGSSEDGSGSLELLPIQAETAIPPIQRESLLERLKHLRKPKQPGPPSQARHVAYPTRVRGHRLTIRPLKTSNQLSDVSEEAKLNEKPLDGNASNES